MKKIELEKIKISDCRSFHKIIGNNGELSPLYKEKFVEVEKYHKVRNSEYFAIAPVIDKSGAYHIDLDGNAIYKSELDKTFGFYCNIAAVKLNQKYFHINIDGSSLYSQRYDWVGNFQENVCVVKQDNSFFHIDIKGNKLYKEKYDYVGDFKDDIAVIHKDGMATHIDKQGNYIHGQYYKNLGIFHKNYANAQDKDGWFHINRKGFPAYNMRYKSVEPFYNGLAFAETFEGQLCQIDTSGEIVSKINKLEPINQMHKISSKFVGFWFTYLVGAAVELKIFVILPGPLSQISKKLNLSPQNLSRFLKALWEIDLVFYNHDKDIWDLSSDGKFIAESQFMNQAAKMWVRVVREENWPKIHELLTIEKISSFPTFKEIETDERSKIEYYNVLIGYSKFDFNNLLKIVDIKPKSNILLFGIHSLSFTKRLKEDLGCNIDYYNSPEIPNKLLEEYSVNILGLDDTISNKKYDIAIFGRFFQHFDDIKTSEYFDMISSSNVERALIIETLVDPKSKIGGCVDINIMVESGGRLRSFEDFHSIIKSSNRFEIDRRQNLTDYLSILDLKRVIQ